MKLDIGEFSNLCECGRVHSLDVKEVVIESGCVYNLPTLLAKYDFCDSSSFTMICDENTYIACGTLLESLFNEITIIKLDSKDLHADNRAVSRAKESLNESSKLLLAVGSGTIHDITRYLSWEYGIPFISVPTAASVDGFVSTVCAMTWNGFKKTMPGVSPFMVIADTDIIRKAPYRLTASGISDLFAKYIAIADWKIAHYLTDEYICNRVISLEIQAMDHTRSVMKYIKSESDSESIMAYEGLMYSLLLSGIAMQMIGNSRPASGAEHHISHLLEMEVVNEALPFYHGEKVSVGLLIALDTYKKSLLDLYRIEFLNNKSIDLEYVLLKETFGTKGLYHSILEENQDNHIKLIRSELYEINRYKIIQTIEELPNYDELKTLLEEAGCIVTMEQLGLNENMTELLIKLSPYVRNRLTWMRALKLLAK